MKLLWEESMKERFKGVHFWRSLPLSAVSFMEGNNLHFSFSPHSHRYGEYREPRRLRPDIHKALAFLQENRDTEASLNELAELVSLSPWHSLRVFREETGLTPHADVAHARFRNAEKLLKAGITPADAVSAAGFADQSHLTRWFRRILGTTTAAYQREIS